MTHVIQIGGVRFMKMKNKLIRVFIIACIIGLFLWLNPTPPVLADPSNSLKIISLEGTNFSFTYEQLLAMPKTEVNANLYCYGSLVTSGNWVGVRLSYLLALAQSTPDVFSIEFLASDGYSVTIPIELAMDPQIIIAYEKDNISLPEGLRLILPDYNGGSWIAMITSLSMSTSTAQYPPGIHIGDITIPSQRASSNNTSSLPQQQETTLPTHTTPESFPINQTTAPANVSNPNQSVLPPQLQNQDGTGIPVVSYYIFASALVLILAVLGGLAYRFKKGGLEYSF
jgi:hypothetical protein